MLRESDVRSVSDILAIFDLLYGMKSACALLSPVPAIIATLGPPVAAPNMAPRLVIPVSLGPRNSPLVRSPAGRCPLTARAFLSLLGLRLQVLIVTTHCLYKLISYQFLSLTAVIVRNLINCHHQSWGFTVSHYTPNGR